MSELTGFWYQLLGEIVRTELETQGVQFPIGMNTAVLGWYFSESFIRPTTINGHPGGNGKDFTVCSELLLPG